MHIRFASAINQNFGSLKAVGVVDYRNLVSQVVMADWTTIRLNLSCPGLCYGTRLVGRG